MTASPSRRRHRRVRDRRSGRHEPLHDPRTAHRRPTRGCSRGRGEPGTTGWRPPPAPGRADPAPIRAFPSLSHSLSVMDDPSPVVIPLSGVAPPTRTSSVARRRLRRHRALSPPPGLRRHHSRLQRRRRRLRSDPDPVARQVTSLVAEMGDAPLAVRSSATGEDGAEHSHAGVADRCLHPCREPALDDEVERACGVLGVEHHLPPHERAPPRDGQHPLHLDIGDAIEDRPPHETRIYLLVPAASPATHSPRSGRGGRSDLTLTHLVKNP